MNLCQKDDPCTLCCKLPAIEDDGLIKAANRWCPHCVPTDGCRIYDERPSVCRSYKCLWLQSQTRAVERILPMSAQLKPNNCHIIFDATADDAMVVARVDPAYPDAARAEPVVRFMDALDARGIVVCIAIGNVLRPHGSIDEETLRLIIESVRVVG